MDRFAAVAGAGPCVATPTKIQIPGAYGILNSLEGTPGLLGARVD